MLQWMAKLPDQAIATFFGRDDRENTLRSMLIKATSGSFALRIASRGLGFIAGTVLARSLSLGSFGVYTYAMSWVLILDIPSMLGLNRILVREMSIYHARQDWPSMKGVLRYAHLLSLTLSLVLALGVFLTSWVMLYSREGEGIKEAALQHGSTVALYTIWVAALLIPLNSLLTLWIGAMQGLHKVVIGQVPDLIVRPVLFISLLGGAALVLDRKLSATGAIGLQVFGSAIAIAYGAYLLARSLPIEMKQARAVYHDLRAWLHVIPPMLWLGVMNMVHSRADFLILGALRGAEDVALYGSAYLLAQFVVLFLTAANLTLAPTFAQIHASGDKARLERVAVKSARAVMLISLPISLGLLVFGKWVLGIYGAEYARAYTALSIMVVGQFINMAAGSVGVLLNMTGNERYTALGFTVGAVVNIALNFLLIPPWGIEGAAVATSVTLFVWNGVLIVFVRRRLGIHSTALGAV